MIEFPFKPKYEKLVWLSVEDAVKRFDEIKSGKLTRVTVVSKSDLQAGHFDSGALLRQEVAVVGTEDEATAINSLVIDMENVSSFEKSLQAFVGKSAEK